MRRICAWCKTDLDTEEQLTDEEYKRISESGETTHGVCEDCYEKETKAMEGGRV